MPAILKGRLVAEKSHEHKHDIAYFLLFLGLAVLVCAWMLNPETAEFKDMLRIFHASEFWKLVGLFAILLFGAEMTLTGKAIHARARPRVAAGSERTQ